MIFIFLALSLMPSITEAGQPGAFAQLSEVVKTAPVAVSVPEPDKARALAGLNLIRSLRSKYWERIECWQDTARPFAVESALNKSRHETPEIISAFGSNLPPASTFLLHYGPKWKTNTGKVVVLAHGASDNANRAWATPAILLGDANAPGLLQALEAKGYRVFAITFPHKHGNLFYEAQYLADAVELARQATGAGKVILIGHSAGGVAARAYVSSFRPNGAWTGYRGDVEQLITMAAPHRGQDFAFRHPEFNYYFMKDELAANAPMSWDKILVYGQWQDTLEFSIYSDNFPMQQQVLYDWTGKYPVSAASPDSYTTLHGGQGVMSHSLGINSAIMKGGNFLNAFRAYPVPADIAVTVIAGTNNKIENVPQTEKDGPSDGLVFVESASHTADLTHPARKEPIQKLLVNENHVTITFSPAMLKLIPGLIK
ncbi:MAG: alpha/beta fold hydrolase [Elusimicrobiota bacterium]|nr:alpha/beta fold hydrolase [Elusimicrobiota bacterium]